LSRRVSIFLLLLIFLLGGISQAALVHLANTKDEYPTGLLNEHERYRDLEFGVFITQDPMGFVDGPNVYTYVRQNPWSSFDPDGLAEFKIGSVYFQFFEGGTWGTWGKAQARHSHVPQLVSLDSGRQRLKEFKADPVKFAKDVRKGYTNPDNPPESLAGTTGKLLAYSEALLSLGRGLKMPSSRPPAMATANGTVIQANGTGVTTPPSLPAGAILQNNQESKLAGNSGKDTSEENAAKSGGRTGDQARLRELGADDKVSSADRGWIKQEQNSIERGQRTRIRRPPGKELAHERGREAAKGHGYEHSNLQDKDLHKLQHKYDDFGRKNKERPVTDDE
jgi:RHS repeat-associated protein